MKKIQVFFNYQGSDFEGTVYPVIKDQELVHYSITITECPPFILEARINEKEQLKWIDVITGEHTEFIQAIGKAIEMSEC